MIIFPSLIFLFLIAAFVTFLPYLYGLIFHVAKCLLLISPIYCLFLMLFLHFDFDFDFSISLSLCLKIDLT